MTTYLLECRCGKSVPVEVGQAGGRISCSCGSVLDVPPLRKLRQLPVAAVEQERSRTRWSTRHGVIAASLIIVVAITAANIWSLMSQPAIPKFDPMRYQQDVDRELARLTPIAAWNLWIDHYRPLAERGFSELQLSNLEEIQAQVAHRQGIRRTLWVVIGIFAVTAAAAAFWPSGRARGPDASR